MRRQAHYIPRNAASQHPQRILFVDTETDRVPLDDELREERFALGVGIYQQRGKKEHRAKEWRYYWQDLDQVHQDILALAQPKQRLVVVAHNMRFDAQVLGRWCWLQDLGWECTCYRDKRGSYQVEWSYADKRILFLDNMNLFSTSLAVLGDDLGFPKLTMPDGDAPLADWWHYCERDVEVMARAWENLDGFRAGLDLGNWQRTGAGLSFTAYRHRFMHHPIAVHVHPRAIALEREGYHGGRVECVRLGAWSGQPFYYLDVNSMYPYVMSSYHYPCNLVSYVGSYTVPELARTIETHAVMAECRLTTAEAAYPAKKKGRLVFPIGEYWTVLTTPEVRYALERGHLQEVGRVAIYEAADLFSDYVDTFYRARQEYERAGNRSYAALCKLYLNSLYGKFGQRNDTWEQVGTVDTQEMDSWTEVDVEDGRKYVYRQHDGIVERHQGYVEGYHSLVAIPAHVTAYARLYLWSLAERAGREHVYYYDTDGLIVDQAGRDRLANLLQPGVLGKLKVEKQADSLEIRGLKNYRFGSIDRIKGIRWDAENLGNGHYRQWTLMGRNDSRLSQYQDRCVFARQSKVLSGEYHKGVLWPDGEITPYTLTAEGQQFGMAEEEYQAWEAERHADKLVQGLEPPGRDIRPQDRAAAAIDRADRRRAFHEAVTPAPHARLSP